MTISIVNAYLHGTSTTPLVIVGDFSPKKYEQVVMEALNDAPPGKQVILTGGIYDQPALTMLRHNCCAYIHGHSKGGTKGFARILRFISKVLMTYSGT
jgi:rhamnosyltransferase